VIALRLSGMPALRRMWLVELFGGGCPGRADAVGSAAATLGSMGRAITGLRRAAVGLMLFLGPVADVGRVFPQVPGAGDFFLLADGGDALGDRDFQFFRRFLVVIKIRKRHPRQALANGALNRAQVLLFVVGDKSKSIALGRRAPGAAHAVNVI